MDVNERIETKRSALLRAESHDLDVAAVAISTVSMIFAEVFPAMQDTIDRANPQFANMTMTVNPLEEKLIRAIDWLCIHESTLGQAITHVNTLMRLFLNNGRLNAARSLLFDLPDDILQQVSKLDFTLEEDVDGQMTEFIHWRSFFDCLSSHLRFVEIKSKQPLTERSTKMERLNWVKGLDGIVEVTETAVMELLQMDWLKLEFEDVDVHAERRRMELAHIRQLYIPELIFRLHFMLVDVREVLPQ